MTNIKYVKCVIECISSEIGSFDYLLNEINFSLIEIENNYIPIAAYCPTAEHNIIIKFSLHPKFNMREAAVLIKLLVPSWNNIFQNFMGISNIII